MPPLLRESPAWFPAEFPKLCAEFRKAFRGAPDTLVVCPDFLPELSSDGVHLTSGSCAQLLDELLIRTPGLPPRSSDPRSLETLMSESAQTRQLLLDLSERVRTNEASGNSVSSRAAELIDSGTNKANESQIEIKG
jgi:hypothetical protein